MTDFSGGDFRADFQLLFCRIPGGNGIARQRVAQHDVRFIEKRRRYVVSGFNCLDHIVTAGRFPVKTEKVQRRIVVKTACPE